MNKLFLTIVLMGWSVCIAFSQELDSAEVVIGTTALIMPKAPQPEPAVVADSVVYWKRGGTLNINLQQVGLTNWAAGGESSFAVGAIIESHANYEKDEVVWENKANIRYGVIRNGDNERFEKTDDILDLSTKFSQKFSEKVLMTASVNFRTQMDEGFKLENRQGSDEPDRVLISDFMSPGYLQASVGLTYRDEKKAFNTTVAPFTGRFTFVLNDSLSDEGAFGVTPMEKVRSEAGISWTGNYKKDVVKNVKLQTQFNFFSNYEKFPNTVVNLEAGLNMKVNNFISSNISSQLIYDDDVKVTRSDGSRGRDVQLKNVINVGFTLGF